LLDKAGACRPFFADDAAYAAEIIAAWSSRYLAA